MCRIQVLEAVAVPECEESVVQGVVEDSDVAGDVQDSGVRRRGCARVRGIGNSGGCGGFGG
eukprot:6214765-Pleurochrysis_carterae.AAC.1